MENTIAPCHDYPRSLKELSDNPPEPNSLIVDGLIPASSVVLFAGPPKSGKSWALYDLGLSVSLGRPWQGIQVKKGTVLYIALEDSYRRLFDRGGTLADGLELSQDLYLSTEWPQNEQGEEQLRAWVSEYRPVLVIIDTWQRWLGMEKTSYKRDYETINRLKTLCRTLAFSLVVVHHTKKTPTKNPLDSVQGSSGLVGAADAILIFGRSGPYAAIYCTGKDLEEQTLPLVWNDLPQGGRWIVRQPPDYAAHRRRIQCQVTEVADKPT